MSTKKTVNFLFDAQGFRPDIHKEELSAQEKKTIQKFEQDRNLFLYELGFEPDLTDSPSVNYLIHLARMFVNKLSRLAELEAAREKSRAPLEKEDVDLLLEEVPFVIGSEFVDEGWLQERWKEMEDAFERDCKDYSGSMRKYFSAKNEGIQTAERIYFHMVENKEGSVWPFAFLATYAAIDKDLKIHHWPLSNALKEFEDDQNKLLSLLSCLSRACEASPLIDEMVTSGEMFHPVGLTSREACEFLKAVPAIEEGGIVCRIPNWWKNHSSSPSLSVSLSVDNNHFMGLETLIHLKPSITVNGVKLTKAQIKELLEKEGDLVYLKGQWVEADRKKLEALLEQMDGAGDDMTFLQALRLEAGIAEDPLYKNVHIQNGKFLSDLLRKMKNPAGGRNAALPKGLHADLRPYQKTGYTWLKNLEEFGFGSCLADDMGLGKTLQVLTLMLKMHQENPQGQALVIAPASLLENWKKEAARFTPDLDVHILHGKPAARLEEDLKEISSPLVITTYQTAMRLEGLQEKEWDLLVLDEAQAIKNPKTKQSKAIKSIPAKRRMALTGTPVENDLINLWSLYDFLNPGLLGTQKEFEQFAKKLGSHPEQYGKLRSMISPFMLRRLKTDKKIISDLPDKIERKEYVALSKRQTALYLDQVEKLKESLESEDSEGIARKGRVLAALNKFKQICNHPDQFAGADNYDPVDSGKFEMLKDICLTIKDKRECVLVFTQYKEIIPQLDAYLSGVFEANGLVIHGDVPVKKRMELVDAFNEQKTYIPYMILSLKAAGTGLNLTRASHVIHFDRWWNPAVENQATDRAFRIGQKKNVVVHKLICSGTIEEKIDEMIESKKELAEKAIGSESAESWITELSDDELLNLVRLNV